MDKKRVKKDLKNIIENTELAPKEKFFSMIILNHLYGAHTAGLNSGDCEHGYVNKHREYFRNIVGDNSYTELLDKLHKLGVLEINDKYSINRFTKSYKPMFSCTGAFTTINAKHYLTSKELSNWRGRVEKMKEKYSVAEWHLKNLKSTVEIDLCLLKLLYNYEFGIELKANNHDEMLFELESLEIEFESKKEEMLHSKTVEVMDLINTDIKIGEKSKRHYHALSNAPKLLRACLKSKNPKKPYLMEIDIKNSQPTILLGLCKVNKLDVEEEISAFIQLGKFYEVIGSNVWGFSKDDITTDSKTRNDVKRLCFKYIMFATSFGTDPFNKLKKVYPKFAKAIETLAKKDKDITLAALLQQKESEIMLPITKKFSGIGIHDSIMVATVKDTEELFKIKNAICKAFNKMKVEVEMDINLIDPENKKSLLEKLIGKNANKLF